MYISCFGGHISISSYHSHRKFEITAFEFAMVDSLKFAVGKQHD